VKSRRDPQVAESRSIWLAAPDKSDSAPRHQPRAFPCFIHPIAAMFSSVHVHRDECFSCLFNLSDQCEPDIKPSSNTPRYLLDHEFPDHTKDHTFHEMEIIFKVSVLQAVLGHLPPEIYDCLSSRFTAEVFLWLGVTQDFHPRI
jgi:hypothetical protein